jgi:hypothetical protein
MLNCPFQTWWTRGSPACVNIDPQALLYPLRKTHALISFITLLLCLPALQATEAQVFDTLGVDYA